MKKLMISLDKKILDPTSVVAQRMIEYGKENELFILIPHQEKKEVQLGDRVHVWSTGGNKLQQYHQLKKMGLELIKKNEIKFITVQDPSFIGNVGRWLKKKTCATFEIQLHGDFYSSNYYKHFLKEYIGYFWFGKKNLRHADQIRVVGERVKNSIVALGISAKKIETYPISLDSKRVSEDKGGRIEFPGYDRVFLFVGRLEDVKGVGWLVDTFGDIIEEYKKNFLLVIVGEGSEKESLQRIVAHRHLEKLVRFETWTNNPNAYYRSVDCVLFPSLSEGYGLVPIEANIVGTKVIMNDVGVANYELKPSENVIILPVDDREEWKKAILSI